MIVQIAIDDLLMARARAVGLAWQKSGHAEHPLDGEHVLNTAINMGLETLIGTWCPGYIDDYIANDPPKP